MNDHDVRRRIDAVRRLTVDQMQAEYLRVFGEITHSRNRQFLFKRIAWRIQVNEFGGLSDRARRRANEIVDDRDIRLRCPKSFAAVNTVEAQSRTETSMLETNYDSRKPAVGSVIVKKYKGQDIRVEVRKGGYEYEGLVYASLSAVAKKITGTQWNGYLFFNLKGSKNRKAAAQ